MSKDLGPVGRRQKELTNYEKWNKGPPATLQFFQHVFKRITLSAHSGLPSAPAGSLELPPRGECSTQSSASCRKGSESRVYEIPKSQAALCAGGGVGAEQWLPALCLCAAHLQCCLECTVSPGGPSQWQLPAGLQNDTLPSSLAVQDPEPPPTQGLASTVATPW